MFIYKPSRGDESVSWLSISRNTMRASIILLLSHLSIVGCSSEESGGNNTGNNSGDNGGDVGTVIKPTNEVAFQMNLYEPILLPRCSACHTSTGAISRSPFFAENNIETALQNINTRNLVNLSMPDASRLVAKVSGNHNCWTNDCAADAAEMSQAITDWADAVGTGEQEVTAVTSMKTSFADGADSVAAARVDTNVIARYEFSTATGNTAFDTSGVGVPMNLTLANNVNWVGEGGIEVAANGATAIATQADSVKLFDMIAGPNGSEEYTLEAWLVANNDTQSGPARAVSYSIDTTNRNFTLGQRAGQWIFRNRNPQTGANGSAPELRAPANELSGVKPNVLQHIVMTYDTTTGRTIYVNGENAGVSDNAADIDALSNWNVNYQFSIGNEITADRTWLGQVKFVAVHNKALTASDVKQNYDAGGNTTILTLKFDVSNLVGVVDTFVSVDVRELDSESYLFTNPKLINPARLDIALKGMRIGVNDTLPLAGQSFGKLDLTSNLAEQDLSSGGAVISKVMGPVDDQFFLDFEILGNNQNIRVEPDPIPNTPVDVAIPASRVGIRNFEEIFYTMASITGVPVDNNAVNSVFDDVKLQLPTTNDANSFNSNTQTLLFKLGFEFCDALVESNTLRTNFFGTNPAIAFNSPVASALGNNTQKTQVASTIVDRMFNINVLTQPDRTLAISELVGLIGNMSSTCVNDNSAGCDAARTRTIVKASCAATLTSAGAALMK